MFFVSLLFLYLFCKGTKKLHTQKIFIKTKKRNENCVLYICGMMWVVTVILPPDGCEYIFLKG